MDKQINLLKVEKTGDFDQYIKNKHPQGSGSLVIIDTDLAKNDMMSDQCRDHALECTNFVIDKIKDGWTDFDAIVATPDMMKSVGKLGKMLGPRGLMPNPKAGTVTFDVAKAVTDIKAGKVEFRVDKNGVIHAPFGKLSFDYEHLLENARSLLEAVIRARPASSKGRYLRGVSVSSTMGPGIRVDSSQMVSE